MLQVFDTFKAQNLIAFLVYSFSIALNYFSTSLYQLTFAAPVAKYLGSIIFPLFASF